MDLNRVYVGHSDNTDDMDYLTGPAEKGAYIGLDGLCVAGNSPGTPDFQRQMDIAAMPKVAGFEHRTILGNDWSV